MVERGALEMLYIGFPISGVQIPLSPPFIIVILTSILLVKLFLCDRNVHVFQYFLIVGLYSHAVDNFFSLQKTLI